MSMIRSPLMTIDDLHLRPAQHGLQQQPLHRRLRAGAPVRVPGDGPARPDRDGDAARPRDPRQADRLPTGRARLPDGSAPGGPDDRGGHPLLVSEGILRARYRDGFEQSVLMTEGEKRRILPSRALLSARWQAPVADRVLLPAAGAHIGTRTSPAGGGQPGGGPTPGEQDPPSRRPRLPAAAVVMRDFHVVLNDLLIPTHVVHAFRRMPSTDSDSCRPPVPTHVVHPFRRMPSTSTRRHCVERGAPARGSRAGEEGAG